MSGERAKWVRKPCKTVTGAYEEIVIFLEELKSYGDLPTELYGPLEVVKRKATRLREQMDARRRAELCPLCEKVKASGLLCWSCWNLCPEELRKAFDRTKAKGGQAYTEAARAIVRWRTEERRKRA